MNCPSCGADNPEGNRFCGDCGNEMIRPEVASHQYGQHPQMPQYRLRVNVFCLIGAIIAVLSLFLPWAVVQTEGTGDERTIGAFDFDESSQGSFSFPSNFRYSVTIFLIGTVLAFLTPLAGVLQLIGSLGFILTASTTTLEGMNLEFWLGGAVGVMASAMVLGALVEPIGVGYEKGAGSGLGRLLTFSAYR